MSDVAVHDWLVLSVENHLQVFLAFLFTRGLFLNNIWMICLV